jgi:hypothetical protein
VGEQPVEEKSTLPANISIIKQRRWTPIACSIPSRRSYPISYSGRVLPSNTGGITHWNKRKPIHFVLFGPLDQRANLGKGKFPTHLRNASILQVHSILRAKAGCTWVSIKQQLSLAVKKN